MSRFEKQYYEAASFWENGAVRDPANTRRLEVTASMIPAMVATLLDAGCGNGVFLERCAAERPAITLTGCDRSVTAVRFASGNVVVASIDKLPFPEHTFDCITCLQVLEHLDTPTFQDALAELTRVARNYLLVSVPFQEVLAANVTRCPACQTEFNVDLHLRSFNTDAVANLFNAHAFRLVRMEFPNSSHRRWFSVAMAHLAKWQKRPRLGFLAPVCPLCGYSEGDRTVLSVVPEPTEKRPSWGSGLARTVRRAGWAALPTYWHPGYWVLALYERTSHRPLS